MTRLWLLLFGLILGNCACGQTVTDSVTKPAASVLYVIPAGPVAGSFTPAARMTVADTVAGWAHVQVEGWVPVSDVLERLRTMPLARGSQNPVFNEALGAPARQQCEAITKKGTRCTRKAARGSKYCWQHGR
jgi:hypothetical protein